MDSCSYPTLVAQTQSSTSKKIEFIDEDKRLAIFPPKHYFTPIHRHILTKFWSLFIFDVFDGWPLRIQGHHHRFFAGKTTTVGFGHSGGHMASVSYYRYHVLFCKIQVRQQSGWSYLLWQPCDECIVKALMTWNKNAQKQFPPHCARASTQTTIPLWKRKQCHFENLSFQIPPLYTTFHNQGLRKLGTRGGYICKQ